MQGEQEEELIDFLPLIFFTLKVRISRSVAPAPRIYGNATSLLCLSLTIRAVVRRETTRLALFCEGSDDGDGNDVTRR